MEGMNIFLKVLDVLSVAMILVVIIFISILLHEFIKSLGDFHFGYVLFLFALIIIFGCVFASITSDFNQEKSLVFISDSNLKTAIKQELKIDEDKYLEKKDLEKIRKIDLSDFNIESIDGIEYAINLKEINLDNNMIKDLTPLRNLKWLEKVSAKNQNIMLYPDESYKLNVKPYSNSKITFTKKGDEITFENETFSGRIKYYDHERPRRGSVVTPVIIPRIR